MPTRGEARPFAAFVDGNPLAPEGWIVDVDAPSRRIVSWSGTMADELFADEPRTWMRAGQDRLKAFLDEVAPALRHHGRTLCFRPHHRHVVGDVHASMKLLRERAGEPFEILLSPADMLAPSMLPTVEDHLTRMFAHLGPVAAAVLLFDLAETPETEETGLLAPLPLGEGRLPKDLVARLLEAHVPAETPVILLPGGLETQREAIGV